jgi:hypothetical protein
MGGHYGTTLECPRYPRILVLCTRPLLVPFFEESYGYCRPRNFGSFGETFQQIGGGGVDRVFH